MDIEIGKMYMVTMPAGEISREGVREIERFINSQKPGEGEWKRLNPDRDLTWVYALPLDWQWTWLVEQGDYRGTFPRRVSKFYHDRFKLKCPVEFIAEIGNIARRHSIEPLVYTIDFTEDIDWTDGEYGDGGSCYWGTHAGGRFMVEENGMAIRLFNQQNGYHIGYGRAWIAPMPERNSTEYYVVFNGYGFEGDSTLRIAQIFAAFMQADYRKVNIVNNGYSSGALYINRDQGYAVGTLDVIGELTKVDLGWDNIYAGVCCNCGDTVLEDEGYTQDDEFYCQHCFYEIYDSCNECGDSYHHNDLIYIDAADYSVCQYCLQQNWITCAECGEYTEKEEGKLHCSDCQEKIDSKKSEEETSDGEG